MALTPPRIRPPFDSVAVVFDLDGLLIDSEGAWARAEEEVVRAFGGQWHPGIHAELLGTSPREAAALLTAYIGGGADPDDVSQWVLAAAEREFAAGLDVRPGAADLLVAVSRRLPVAVATNSPRRLASLALTTTRLSDHVQVLVSAEDAAAPKPAPDPYLTACGLLGREPARSIAFEDSPVGAMAARAAGLWVVGCPSLADTSLDAAHTVVGSLVDVDPDALLGRAQPLPAGASV